MLFILIGIVALLFVVGGLMLVIFAFLHPWAVVAVFGMIVAGVVFYYRGKKGRK